MSTETERQLRDVLTELGTVDPPAGVADGALRRAGRRRRRNIAAMATGAAAVLAVAIVVPVSLKHGTTAPAAPPPAVPQRNVVVSYSSSQSQGPAKQGPTLVLDPSTGKYVESKLSTEAGRGAVPKSLGTLIPSPDGQYYATSGGDRVGTVAAVIAGKLSGFRQLHAGAVADSGVSWSADSTRLLIPVWDRKLNTAGFRIYNLRTRTLGTLVRIPALKGGNVQLSWGPGESLMALTGFSDRGRERVFFLNLAGRTERSITLPNHLSAEPVLSPDGRYLALDNGSVLDLKTGRPDKPQLPGHQANEAAIVGWLDNDHYIVNWITKNGTAADRRLVVLTNSGKRTKTITPPLGTPTLPETSGKYTVLFIRIGFADAFPAGSGFQL